MIWPYDKATTVSLHGWRMVSRKQELWDSQSRRNLRFSGLRLHRDGNFFLFPPKNSNTPFKKLIMAVLSITITLHPTYKNIETEVYLWKKTPFWKLRKMEIWKQ